MSPQIVGAVEHVVDPIVDGSLDSLTDFATMYRDWFRIVHRWVCALGGPSGHEEDVTQEIFLVVHRKLSGFDGEHPGAWLYSITRKTVSDHRRRAWFRRMFLRARDIDIEAVQSGAADSLELAIEREDKKRFYCLVEKMNPKWREAFVLFEVLGYEGAEIAQLMGMPPATIRANLYRGRKQFLGLLDDEESKEVR